MRNAAQCVGRVLRGKTDWGLMVFADKVRSNRSILGGTECVQRYARADKRAKLPKWINQYITETASNLSTDMAIVLSKLFMRTISQSSTDNQLGVSLWSLEDVKKAQEKQKLLLEAQEYTQRVNDVDGYGSDDYGDGGIPDEMLVDMDIE